MESYASDLNPVAVLINKAKIEIPPKFAGMPPVNPESRRKRDISSWRGAQGLAEDVGYYGKWMREEAEKRIGHLYPKVKITPEMVAERSDLKPYEGKELTVIAWIWTRTVKSPNPAFSKVNVPLTSTFMLATKPGKEAYVDPVIEGEGYRFSVRAGRPKDMKLIRNGTKLSRGANFQCLMSTTPISGEYIKSEGASGRMGARLMAIVAEGNRERVYLSPTADMESTATAVLPSWKPETPLPEDMRSHWTPPYGLRTYGDLFTARQLVALTTLSDLAQEAREKSQEDALAGGFTKEERPLSDGGAGALAYGEAVGIYLAFVVEKLSESHSSICTWSSAPKNELVVSTFRRQGLPMTWDYAESNPFAESSGSIGKITEAVARVLILALPANVPGQCSQQDASSQALSSGRLVSTDPPYYDNIGYADLSDFFYVWMRRTLKHVFPKLFATLAVPKIEELVAAPYRHGGSEKAEVFFLKGMTLAMHRIAEQSHPAFPVTIYYAFKQSESKNDVGTASTGWETFLAAVLKAGFAIKGTWPVRTEREGRSIGIGTNALASSVILVCERRLEAASILSRTKFRRQLRQELPQALQELERANIAPVDVAQAAIGPGMAIFSSAKAVLNPDDSPMSVRDALIEINAALDEYLSEDEGELDGDSRFALTFFESFGYAERDFGDAEGLAKARNLSVDGVARAGILRSVAGKVQLLQRSELPEDWDPTKDKRLCVWEATQQLIKRLGTGEQTAAALLAQLKEIPGHGDLPANCRALSYRLYNHCEKTKQAEEARAYNGLVIAWPELEKLAAVAASPVQPSLL